VVKVKPPVEIYIRSGAFAFKGGEPMSTEEFKRRLTAILSADVQGYSRLMRDDEEATVRTITSYRTAMTHLIEQYRGRVVDSPGDNILAEFTSVVDAVNCGVEIQRELAERNAELPENRQMRFRIGINLGDVLEEGKRIYGDGVNIAARMEALAEAGGIAISGTVHDAIENKVGLEYEDLGEHQVKNIDKPVRAYRVLSYPGAAAHRVVKAKRAVGRTWRNAMVAIAVVLVAGAAFAVWNFYGRAPKIEPASKEKMAFPLPDKPSIAVLPFVNMSGDPKQEFFSDGVTEGIITALSRSPDLLVIARNSTFTYKGKPVKIKQVSEELGVRYVLEGSIQRSEDRVRITAQLIDAISGHHVWAQRYDRDLKEIFALQDEITMKVLAGVQVKLAAVSGDWSLAEKMIRGKRGLDCYLKYLEAMKTIEVFSIESFQAAGRIAEEIIEMCPEASLAYSFRAAIYMGEYWLGLGKSPQESIEKGMEMAQKALAIDDSNSFAHAELGQFYSFRRKYDKALAEAERAVVLDPNGFWTNFWHAGTLSMVGRSEEALAVYKKVMRLSPKPDTYLSLNFAHALRELGRYEEAVSEYKKSLQLSPNSFTIHVVLTATYSMMGKDKEARAQAEEVLRLNPKFSCDLWAKTLAYKDQSVTDHFVDALRKAGLK
jgi:adenylate cyclase